MTKRIKIILIIGVFALLATVGFSRYLIWLTRDKTREYQEAAEEAFIRETPLLSDDDLRTYAPTTKKRVLSIQQVPEDVRNVFFDDKNVSKGLLRDKGLHLVSQKLEQLKEDAAKWKIADRSES